MLATLPESAKVDADNTFAPLCLPALQLLIDLKEAGSHFKEHLILIIADGLQTAQVTPKILGLFDKLINRFLEIGVSRGDIEIQAAENMDAVFFPMLGKRDDGVERDNAPVLGRCLGKRLGV